MLGQDTTAYCGTQSGDLLEINLERALFKRAQLLGWKVLTADSVAPRPNKTLWGACQFCEHAEMTLSILSMQSQTQ